MLIIFEYRYVLVVCTCVFSCSVEGHALLPGEGGHGGDAHEPRDHLPSPGNSPPYRWCTVPATFW
jgi:hypothetical protein